MQEKEHSAKFEKVKGYYEAGLWTEEMVRNAAHNPKDNPWITEEEAEEIVGAELCAMEGAVDD